MKRREFISLLGSVAAWPLVARAAAGDAGRRLPERPIIRGGGLCGDRIPPRPETPWLCRSDNVAIEYRFAEDRLDPLPELPADLVDRQVAVIFGNLSAELFWEVP